MALSASINTTNDVRSAFSTGTTSVQSIGVVAPVNTAIGDTLVMAAAHGNTDDAIAGPTGGAGSGWTAVFNGSVPDDLRMAVWVKLAAVSADVGATFTATKAGSILPMVASIVRIPGADPTGMRNTQTKLATTDSTTGVVPTPLVGVLPTDLAFEIYGTSQNDIGTMTLTYATQPTWSQVAKVNTTNTGSGRYNSGLVIIAKMGGGLTGDPSTQPTVNTTGRWACVSLALKPALRGSFLPFFR